MISRSCGYAAAATALLALSGVSSFGEFDVHPRYVPYYYCHYYLDMAILMTCIRPRIGVGGTMLIWPHAFNCDSVTALHRDTNLGAAMIVRNEMSRFSAMSYNIITARMMDEPRESTIMACAWITTP